jgi:hypothetical protein
MMVMMIVMPCGLPVEQQGGDRSRRDSELHTTYQNLQRTEEFPAAASARGCCYYSLIFVNLYIFFFSFVVLLVSSSGRILVCVCLCFPAWMLGHGCCLFGLCLLLLRSILVVYEDKSLQFD